MVSALQALGRYGLNVPVLPLDGRVICGHRLDTDELSRFLGI
jgi:hypothetical protein